MPGPPPKDPRLRARTNKHSTFNSTTTEEQPRLDPPILGECPNGEDGWHPRTLQWWGMIWSSPVTVFWLSCDQAELIKLAVLEDQFWKHPTPQIAAEIRLQRQCFGLTSLDRRRLQWEVNRAEESERKKKPVAPQMQDQAEDDPRHGLTAV